MQNLYDDLEALLRDDPALVDEHGKLNKNVLVTRAANLDAEFLKRLLSSETIKGHFFAKVGETQVFDKAKFQEFIANKAFMPDSYTAFRNKIGLTDRAGRFLSASEDVVLAWPYKDCVLEGGMTKEDVKRDEVFWNTTLAPDDITRLFEPKALTGFERWDAEAVKEGKPKAIGKIDPDKDNLLIKGNNLLALHSLKRRYAGQVKLIYIDPPYNTGGDSFRYNDRFNHSAWLTFMRNRLEVAKELLRPDGAIFVNLDDNEAHYAKVIMDEVFGRENFVANVIWQKKYAPQNDAAWFSDDHDHIIVYAKTRRIWKPNGLPRKEEALAKYKNPDNDPRGPWRPDNALRNEYREYADFEVVTPAGRSVRPPPGTSWRFNKEDYPQLLADGRLWFGKDGKGVPAVKRYLAEVRETIVPQTLWFHKEVGHNQEAKRHLAELGIATDRQTPKPERLIERVVHITTNPNDLVLDFFLGSGTTAAVAHKMGRRWIGVDQMDYVSNVTMARLKKVIEGEQGGISKEQNWRGGGSFVYVEFAEANDCFATRIRNATDDAALAAVGSDLREKGWWRYKVDQSLWNWDEWAALPFDERKQLLLDSLDANHLYVNYGDIDDADTGLSAENIATTKAFYKGQA